MVLHRVGTSSGWFATRHRIHRKSRGGWFFLCESGVAVWVLRETRMVPRVPPRLDHDTQARAGLGRVLRRTVRMHVNEAGTVSPVSIHDSRAGCCRRAIWRRASAAASARLPP